MKAPKPKRVKVVVKYNKSTKTWRITESDDQFDSNFYGKVPAIRKARSICRERKIRGERLLLTVHNKNGRIAFEAAYPTVRNRRKPGERDKG